MRISNSALSVSAYCLVFLSSAAPVIAQDADRRAVPAVGEELQLPVRDGLALASAGVIPASGGRPAVHVHRGGGTLPDPRAIEQVRKATAKYLDLGVAKAAGWTDQYPEGCAVSPEGAQAYHYLNPSLVDGEVDLLRPELLMYEPRADGSMDLVGVDYVIPFDRWPWEEPPTLLGQPLMRNEPLGVWAIHIWAWRENPSGMFAPWNPDVSCEHAS